MNTIAPHHLHGDVFTHIAKFLSTEETVICTRICWIWNKLFDTTLIWDTLFESNFDKPLTYRTFSKHPQESYLEKCGVALHEHAEDSEIQHLEAFQGIGRPFKPLGHLVIGCLGGTIVAKNLHNGALYKCSGRPDQAAITSLDASEEIAGTIQIYTGSEDGSIEEWNLTSQTWTRKIAKSDSSITVLQKISSSQICVGYADGSIFLYDLIIPGQLDSFNLQNEFLDGPVLHIQSYPMDKTKDPSLDVMIDEYALHEEDSSESDDIYCSLVKGHGICMATKKLDGRLIATETATCFAWHKLSNLYFYYNDEKGKIMRQDFNMRQPETFKKGSPYSNVDNQGFILINDLLISWHPNRAFWVGSTAIKIWDLTTESECCLQTLNVDDQISEMAATGSLLVAYSKESKRFHVWGKQSKDDDVFFISTKL